MMKRLRELLWLAGLMLVGAAVYQELQKPCDQRTWHGQVAGVIPYDFRVPTFERVRQAYWNPDDPRIFTDPVLNVGWSINLYRLLDLARGLRST